MTDEGEPVPHLRRDPNPSTANGRKVLIAVAVFFLLLVGFVLTLVFTIGLHNNGVKLPHTSARSTPPPAKFFAITPPGVLGTPAGGTAYVTPDGSGSVRPPHLRAVAIGVAADGSQAYSAYPVPGCRSRIELTRLRSLPNGDGLTRSAKSWIVSGRVLPVPMAVSPDGTKIALVATLPAAQGSKCVSTAIAVAYDLTTRESLLDGPVSNGGAVSLTWEADSSMLDVLSSGSVTREPIPCGACNALQLTTLTAVSVDPTGRSLLVLADPQTVHYPGDIRSGAVYEWSAGKSTRITGGWVQPAW